MLARNLPEQDIRPAIIDGPKIILSMAFRSCFILASVKVTIPQFFNRLSLARLSIGRVTRHEILSPDARTSHPAVITPCPDLPSSTVMFLSSVGAPFLRPGLHSHRAPRAAAVKGSAQPRGATRSRLFAASMASTASTGP